MSRPGNGDQMVAGLLVWVLGCLYAVTRLMNWIARR